MQVLKLKIIVVFYHIFTMFPIMIAMLMYIDNTVLFVEFAERLDCLFMCSFMFH